VWSRHRAHCELIPAALISAAPAARVPTWCRTRACGTSRYFVLDPLAILSAGYDGTLGSRRRWQGANRFNLSTRSTSLLRANDGIWISGHLPGNRPDSSPSVRFVNDGRKPLIPHSERRREKMTIPCAARRTRRYPPRFARPKDPLQGTARIIGGDVRAAPAGKATQESQNNERS